MKKLTLSVAGLALSAAPLLAQAPAYPVPYAPAPWGYPQPAPAMMWARPMVPVYYMPQPYVQVVPVPVAKVQAAGALTREGIYPLDGYRPQLPAARTAPAGKPAADGPLAVAKPASARPTNTVNTPSDIQPAGATWSSGFMPWLRPANASTAPTATGSVTSTLRQDLGPQAK